MGIISGLKSNFSDPKQWLINILGGGPTSSGVQVNEDNAITYSAVHNAIQIYSEITAMLPLNVYRRLKPRGKERAQTHPLYQLLHDQPNPEMTSFLFRETLMGHLLTYRNAYAEIEYDNANRVKGLWPLMPNRTWPERDKKTNKLYYKVILPGGNRVELPSERVFHVPGRSYNGIKGINLIQLMKESIGSGLAMEKYGATFFKNDGTPGGVLEHPGAMSDPAQNRFKDAWQKMHGGLENKHRIAILEEGMKWHQISISPEEAQMLESKKFQITEIARWFNMPPHLLKDLERATFSNIEEQSLEFVIYCLMPWLKRWEQQIQKDLVGNKEFYAEFLVDGLLRGDIESRYNAYSTAIQNGIMSRNEVRDRENMNPYSGGDEYLVQLNMISASMLDDVDEGSSNNNRSAESNKKKLNEMRARRSAAGRRNLALAYEKVIKRSAKNMIENEVKQVREKAKEELSERNEGNFQRWLEEFYEGFPADVRKEMAPVINTFAEAIAEEAGKEINIEEIEGLDIFVRNYVESFSIRYSRYSSNQLKALIDEALNEGENSLELIEQRLDEWEACRPEKVAKEESVKGAGAFSKFTFMAGGITKLMWVTMGSDPCPFCQEMDGEIVGIEQYFLNAGDSMDVDDKDEPLQVEGNIGHPPLHEGCECGISPA